MYSFLFNQTYLSIFAIAILVFLLMFLWRKLTILEGNYYLLEKRVNIIKKEERNEQLSKNTEKADIIMNEVFKNSQYGGDIKQKCTPEDITNVNINCENINKYCENTDVDVSIIDVFESKKGGAKNTKAKKQCNLKDGVVKEATLNILPDVIKYNDIDIPYKSENVTINNTYDTGVVSEAREVCEVREVSEAKEVSEAREVCEAKEVSEAKYENTINDVNELKKHIDNITNDDNIEYINTDNIIETESITSDITFNNEDDKTLSRKLKSMNLEKLREECRINSLSADGTKSMLIARLIDNIKKQK